MKTCQIHFIFFIIYCLILCSSALAFGHIEQDTSLTFESRYFTKRKNQTLLKERDFNRSQNSLRFNFALNTTQNNFTFHLEGLARKSFDEVARDFYTFNHTFIRYEKANTLISLGNHIFNWSIMDFFTLGDFYNPQNLRSTSLDSERLGITSLNAVYNFERSFLQLVFIIDNLYPVYPTNSNQLGLGVDLESPKAVKDDDHFGKPRGEEYMARFKAYLDFLELEVHLGRKIDFAHPLYLLTPTPAFNQTQNLTDINIRPVLFPMRFHKLMLQKDTNFALLKFSHLSYQYDDIKMTGLGPQGITSIKRDQLKRYALGIEKRVDHTIHTSHLNIEYTKVYDTPNKRTYGPFQDDLYLGFRYSFNDISMHELNLSVVLDTEGDQESIYALRHSFSLEDSWKLESQISHISVSSKSTDVLSESSFYGLLPLRDSDNILFNLTRYF